MRATYPRKFPNTRHSAVLGVRSEGAERERSWQVLVAAYWTPVYAHLRVRWGKSPDDAADLTQSFFSYALEKDVFQGYDPGRARFRTFVRVCVDRFAGGEDEARRAQKRGGGRAHISLDAAEADLSRSGDDPQAGFDREWRRALFGLAIESLRAFCNDNGKHDQLALFERYDLAEDERPTYADLARELDLPVTTVTNHLAWARRQLRRLVLERLAELTASDEEYRSEARALFGVDG